MGDMFESWGKAERYARISKLVEMQHIIRLLARERRSHTDNEQHGRTAISCPARKEGRVRL